MKSQWLVVRSALAGLLALSMTSFVMADGPNQNKTSGADARGQSGSPDGSNLKSSSLPPAPGDRATAPDRNPANEPGPRAANDDRGTLPGTSPRSEPDAQHRDNANRDPNDRRGAQGNDRIGPDEHYRWRDGRWWYVFPDNRTYSYEGNRWVESAQSYSANYPPDAPADAAAAGPGCGASGGCGTSGGCGCESDCGCHRHHRHRHCCG